jgi:hypothetical protein
MQTASLGMTNLEVSRVIMAGALVGGGPSPETVR